MMNSITLLDMCPTTGNALLRLVKIVRFTNPTGQTIRTLRTVAKFACPQREFNQLVDDLAERGLCLELHKTVYVN